MGRTTGTRCARTSPRRPPSAGGPDWPAASTQPSATRRLRVALVAATVVAAVAAAVLIGLPRTPGPEAVSAAVVLERALRTVSSGRTWQADVVMKAADWNRSLAGYHYDLWRYHFVQSTDGSYLLTQLGPTRRVGSGAPASRRVTDVVAYDASTGVLRHLKPGRRLSVVRDVALGPPDRWASPLTGVDFGASLRTLEAVGAVKLEKTEIDGRQAWTVTCTKGTPAVFPSGSGAGHRLARVQGHGGRADLAAGPLPGTAGRDPHGRAAHP